MTAPERGTATLAPELARRVGTVARALVAAGRSWSLYPPGHPAVRTSLDRLTSAIRAASAGQALSFGVSPDALMVEGIPVTTREGTTTEAAAWLHHTSIAIEQIDYAKVFEDREVERRARKKDDLWRAIHRRRGGDQRPEAGEERGVAGRVRARIPRPRDRESHHRPRRHARGADAIRPRARRPAIAAAPAGPARPERCPPGHHRPHQRRAAGRVACGDRRGAARLRNCGGNGGIAVAIRQSRRTAGSECGAEDHRQPGEAGLAGPHLADGIDCDQTLRQLHLHPHGERVGDRDGAGARPQSGGAAAAGVRLRGADARHRQGQHAARGAEQAGQADQRRVREEDPPLLNTWETDGKGEFRYAVEEGLDPDAVEIDPLTHL